MVAAGSPGLVHGELIRPGAVVVDCGINVVDGAIVGDVDAPSVSPIAEALTPVPGGVGPVTNALLMEHLRSSGGTRSRAPSVTQPSSLEIAQGASLRPIAEIADELGHPSGRARVVRPVQGQGPPRDP